VLARAWDAGTEQLVAPFYRNQVTADRARLAAVTAMREGRDPVPPDTVMTRLAAAASRYADAFRAFMETVLCPALPQDVIERPA
jgi:hypothetical protein